MANRFSSFAERATVEQLILDVQTATKNRIAAIENSIDSKRKIAQQRRFDRIAELQEAIRIAEKLGLNDRADSPAQVFASASTSNTSNSTPLYYRGSSALLAELEVLRSRPSDDPFIEHLRDNEEELARLQSMSIDATTLNAAKIDQPAFAPTTREKPKRKLIVMLGFVLGGMLGVFAAFFVNFVQNQKQNEAEATA